MTLNVGILGMGYVGLTLAAAMARAGHTVHGVDSQQRVVDALNRAEPHIFEPGLAEVFREKVGKTLFASTELPDAPLDVVMISVSTPVDPQTHQVRLENLRAATEAIARTCSPETLVVVRSTVPIGTSRNVVLPILQEAWGVCRLVMAPERTIQGQALRELVDLPQVVGGLDEPSLDRGVQVFEQLAKTVVPVGSLETAEMVKLANNCHTDLIYAFGNEIALIAEQHGVDPLEVIRATNVDYPRPDLSRPGFVGGACLTKDPYIMIGSAPERTPFLVPRARELNEYLPIHVANTCLRLLEESRGTTEGATLGILGWACKGWPPTDDMRGTAVEPMIPVLEAAGVRILGHDPMVRDEVLVEYGGIPTSLADICAGADGVLVINDHPEYRGLDIVDLLGPERPAFVYDAWRVLDEASIRKAGLVYAGLGYERGAL